MEMQSCRIRSSSRLPQSKYIDGIQSLDANNNHSVESLSSWASPSCVSSLEVAGNAGGGSFKPMLSAATCSGSLHVLMADLVEGAEIEEVSAVEGEGFHVGRVEGVDWREGGGECVTVGDDGRVRG
ncbi:hypothetical protein F2Q69_00033122 [Brassica cretica]|uniref:Uncharacterized protein n=1 Tax=Brassica cretica TaxID=69181 RepID=A0A8S9SC15_BRACR|nr:hypothetical protein F2Q69_00033122 [Brassica cretica]